MSNECGNSGFEKERARNPALSYLSPSVRLPFRIFSEIVFPPSDVVVVGRLISPVSSPIEKRMVVRARPSEGSGRVLYPSWPSCVHAMIMMIAGYMLFLSKVNQSSEMIAQKP
jgi:hypothetical protein